MITNVYNSGILPFNNGQYPFFILEDLLTFSMFAYIILLKEKDEEMVYLSIMSNTAELLNNLDKLHTTELGVVRIKRNLSLETDDVVEWCREKIKLPNAEIVRRGKNYYAEIDGCVITVNAHSFTIVTAKKQMNRK